MLCCDRMDALVFHRQHLDVHQCKKTKKTKKQQTGILHKRGMVDSLFWEGKKPLFL